MKHLKISLLVGLILNIGVMFAQDGEKLFRANCASCHAYGRKLVGPDLTGVTEKRDHEWLTKWIKSSSTLIKEGDELAIQIFNDYNKVPMPDAFLNDAEMDALMSYMKTKTSDAMASSAPPTGAETASATEQADEKSFGSLLNSFSFAEYTLFSLACLFLVIIFIMSKTIQSLSKRLSDEFESNNW